MRARQVGFKLVDVSFYDRRRVSGFFFSYFLTVPPFLFVKPLVSVWCVAVLVLEGRGSVFPRLRGWSVIFFFSDFVIGHVSFFFPPLMVGRSTGGILPGEFF